MKIRTPILALMGLALLAPAAQAAEHTPAWGVLAATGPTHLAPRQSEVQRITVEAEEEGSFSLARRFGEGTGTPSTLGGGVLSLTAGSVEAKILSEKSYAVGQRLAGSRLPADTTILSCSTDCKSVGSFLTLSEPAESSGATVPTIFTTKLTGATASEGSFHLGDVLSGEGIAPGTEITAIEGSTLTTTKATTSAYSSGAIALTLSERTEALPADASAEALQGAFDALPAFAPESFTVTGGPGGDAEHPYFVTFGGAEFSETDVEALTASWEGLGPHGFVHIFTTVPGGNGTGLIGVFATNYGTEAAEGTTTVEVGPLPAGIAVPEASTTNGWSCGEAEPGETLTCTTAGKVATFSQPYPVKAPVEVRAGAAPESSAVVRISGAGAGEASFQMPIVVSSQPAPPGIAAFTFGSYEADGSLSTQAGAHPYSTQTEFILNSVRAPGGQLTPAGDAKDVIVNLPAGLVGNPMVVERCPQSALTPEVGYTPVECGLTQALVGSFQPKLGFGQSSSPFGIYSNVPARGTAAQFSSKNVSPIVALFGSLRSEGDFGPTVTSYNSATQFQQVISGFTVFEGFPAAAGGKAFFTNPSDCAEQARSAPQLRTEISTWLHPDEFSVASVQLPPVTGCDKLSLHPQFSFQPSSTRGSSPVGADAHLHMDQSGLTDPKQLGAPPLKRSVVKLPEGLALNPSQANGLEACSESQVGYKGPGALPNPTRFNNDPVSCPDGSKLGTAEASSPLLDEPLKGTIYLAKQDENPFHSLIGLYLVFESPRFGITLKLPGKVEPDPTTGRLTATFDYLPQQPVEDFYLHFRGGGPRSELATPEVCGPHTTTGSWEPWSAPQSGPPAQTYDTFTVAGDCASSSGARPFNPSFEAGTTNPIAGAYSPLVVRVKRADGEQELRRLDFTLPGGLAAKLTGMSYCSDADIAAAQSKTGRQEQANPSCPASTRLGSVDAAAGVGSEPFHTAGDVYLAGRYKGAPISAVVITPAVAGPFDLGNVVIRNPLYIDENTAQVTVKSDPIPTILDGIPLKVREVSIQIDRQDFTFNPTSCEATKVTASIRSSDGATATPDNRFQVGGCENLAFKPKTYFRLYGGTHRGAHPKIRAVYETKAGEANLLQGAFTIPRSEFLDQAHIRTICTRVQFAANACPKGAIYGHVKAFSPIVNYPVQGPVYLESSNHNLPDLVFDLRGPVYQPVHVVVALRIDSHKGQIRVTAEGVPDLPVSKLIFTQQGGKKGLLVNSRNICTKAYRADVATEGHNGKTSDFRPVLSNSKCKKARKKRHGGHRKRGGRR